MKFITGTIELVLMLAVDAAIALSVLWTGFRWFVIPVLPNLNGLKPLHLLALVMLGRFAFRGFQPESEESKKLPTFKEKMVRAWTKTIFNLPVAAITIGVFFVLHLLVTK